MKSLQYECLANTENNGHPFMWVSEFNKAGMTSLGAQCNNKSYTLLLACDVSIASRKRVLYI